MSSNCQICSKLSSSYCSNCKKVVYCGKEHQKQDRKRHKQECYPASITTHPVLGNHLQATREINAGEKIFKEEPLIVGPRSNFSHFHQICLGCCDKIKEGSTYSCSKCGWPVCDANCEQNMRHAKFECPIFADKNVSPAATQAEYLGVTFLRCILLQTLDPSRWDDLLKLESHIELRNSRPACVEQSQLAIHFVRDKCKMTQTDPRLIDRVYGIVIVNGYGDLSTFGVKLYSKSAKLSHACIPNTRTILDSNGIEIVATVAIKAGQPLTQLYGRIFKGTHPRQELLQNIYYFSCSCTRCKDPSELGTYFSGVKCHAKKCGGHLLPKNPLDISPASKWKCDSCNNSSTFARCVVPALGEISQEAGTDENEGLYSEYELYEVGNPEIPVTGNLELTTATKLDHVLKMLTVLKKLETGTVHRNHYALLPLKTALIATIHSLLALSVHDAKSFSFLQTLKDEDMVKYLLEEFLRLVKEMLQVVEILLPGMTSERGLLLFYLAEGMRFSIHNTATGPNQSQLAKLQEEASCNSFKIMLLDNEDDDHRKLVVKYLGHQNAPSLFDKSNKSSTASS